MIILDTTVWIEHIRNNPNYFSKVKTLMENMDIRYKIFKSNT